ncbi:MAG: hypothetical protein KAS92_00515 [Candidatus Omnitrophica bacterium]|nr:hypothetical protein [Candidatus Omnitrophota bacterium]
MLYIATDLENKNWLVYLLEELRRINGAEFDIEIIDADQKREGNVLYYTKSFTGSPAIVNKSDVLLSSKTVKVSDDIFIVDGTQTDDSRFEEECDIFWNAFVFLSRLEEHVSVKQGRTINSYSFKHSRSDKATFEVPVVNNLFNRLEMIISKYFPDCRFHEGAKPIIELSHDVDYINKTLQFRLRRFGLSVINSLKNIHKPKFFLKHISSGWKFLTANTSYWCFDYWQDLEKRLERKSIFYVYVKTKSRNIKNWLINPSYDISRNIKLQKTLHALGKEGFQIGLHGSYQSAVDREALAREKRILENILGHKVDRVRQHWLRYEEDVTPYVHNELFEYDSTLGWNDAIGFRSGCASRYKPYDHKAQKGFDFFETPQVIMDGNIFDHDDDDREEIIKRAFSLLERLKRCKNAHAAISWHQRSSSADYQWHKVYEELANSI